MLVVFLADDPAPYAILPSMTILESILLGIVEGVTEFLPISSTGHLILVSSLLGVLQTDFTKSFEIAIQLGAILAVITLFWRSFLKVETLAKVVVAFVPTGVIGFALYHILKSYLLGNTTVVVFSLFVGGIIFIVFERWIGTRELPTPTPITYRQAFLVGVCQAVAIIPGISRSGATIIGGLALGIERAVIVEFSFLLAVPTMLAATCLDLAKSGFLFTRYEWLVLCIGFTSSFLVALPSVRWLLKYVRRHSFVPFGIYRICVALVFGAVLFFS